MRSKTSCSGSSIDGKPECAQASSAASFRSMVGSCTICCNRSNSSFCLCRSSRPNCKRLLRRFSIDGALAGRALMKHPVTAARVQNTSAPMQRKDPMPASHEWASWHSLERRANWRVYQGETYEQKGTPRAQIDKKRTSDTAVIGNIIQKNCVIFFMYLSPPTREQQGTKIMI